ncbi:hypothetical protein B0H17DRAFT_1146105 [Mycena rosella]|uniref:Uncharacterized protein n=1 Tax=Mycena rosella TaxID=1033263 RepID=A0AAD7G4V1_MYCRO|nr:hypothetical protein B0H17DRAFT_1146105 [Mycena rosella]
MWGSLFRHNTSQLPDIVAVAWRQRPGFPLTLSDSSGFAAIPSSRGLLRAEPPNFYDLRQLCVVKSCQLGSKHSLRGGACRDAPRTKKAFELPPTHQISISSTNLRLYLSLNGNSHKELAALPPLRSIPPGTVQFISDSHCPEPRSKNCAISAAFLVVVQLDWCGGAGIPALQPPALTIQEAPLNPTHKYLGNAVPRKYRPQLGSIEWLSINPTPEMEWVYCPRIIRRWYLPPLAKPEGRYSPSLRPLTTTQNQSVEVRLNVDSPWIVGLVLAVLSVAETITYASGLWTAIRDTISSREPYTYGDVSRELASYPGSPVNNRDSRNMHLSTALYYRS